MTDTSPAGANSRQLLREAIGAVKAGDKDAARLLVRQGLTADPFNEQLHLLAASLARTVKEAVPHVEQVLAINPNNEKAQAWLEQVRKKAAMKALQNGAETRAEPAHQSSPKPDKETIPPSQVSKPDASPAAGQPARDPKDGRPLTLVERLLAEQRQALSAPLGAQRESGSNDSSPQAARDEPSGGGIDAARNPADEPLGGSIVPGRGGAKAGAGREPDSSRERQAEEPTAEAAEPAQARWAATPSVIADPPPTVDRMATTATTPQYPPRVSPAAPVAAGKAPEETHAGTEESWQCPLCEHAAAAPQRRCPQCYAAVHLAAAEMITRHETVDEAALRRAIERWNAALEKGPDADAHIALALAHLNLNESAQALTHLRRACELRGGDSELGEAFRTVRARKLVVIAEEDESLRKVLVELLEGHRLRTRAATNGFQALTLVEEEMPDLILASGSMPRMAGYELCKVVRGNASTKGTPVVLMVDKVGLVDKARGLAAGATAYLTRPIDGGSVLRTLKSLLPDSTLPDPKLSSNTMFKL